MERKFTKKKLRQELVQIHIDSFNTFLLAFDNSNEILNIEGWASFRFNKELFIRDLNRWSFLTEKLSSNIRIYYPTIEDEGKAIKKIKENKKVIPILFYHNGNFFFKDQIQAIQEKEIIEKLFQFFSLYKKFYFILKVHSAIIKEN
jgi:hypothetical protein